MTNPSATITPSYNSGSVDLTWQISNIASNNLLKSIKSLVNENSANSAIVETNHPVTYLFNPNSDNPVHAYIQKITMGTDLLQLGKSHYVQLEFLYQDNTKIRSNTLVLLNKTVPVTPWLVLGTNVRSEDQGVSINIGSLYTLNSVSDGYSPITKATVIISKIGGVLETDYQVQEVNISSYADWYEVNATGLQNQTSYEIAVKLSNAMGDSVLSNTLVFEPKDTPSEISSVKAFSLLSDQKRKNQQQVDELGSVVLYWTKPDDYNNLITSNRRVLKYIIREQLYVESLVDGTVTNVPSGPPTLIDLIVPQHNLNAHSTASFELPINNPELFFVNSTETQHQYKYVIPGSSERLGKQFRYTVVANNINGDGPLSSQTGSVFAFKAADSQPFILNHSFTTSNVTATPVDIYNGKMTIKIEAGTLAKLNGGLGYSQNSAAFIWPENAGFVIPQDEKLRLEVIKESDQQSIYNDLVLFKQKVTTTSSGGQITSYTATGEYNFDFDDISLNNSLALGIKYRFHVFRENRNPVIVGDSFKSPVSSKLRTKFKSPNAVSKIQSYAINDDLTPVLIGGNSAVRLMFEQVNTSDLGGCDVFIPVGDTKPDIQYSPYQGSLLVPDIAPISHDPTYSGVREFILPSIIGNSVAQYIRFDVLNTELNIRISGAESSPAVSETAFTYPLAIASASINKISSNQITVSFNRQAFNNLGGSSSVDIQNRIIVIKDEESLPIHEVVVQHNAGANYTSNALALTNGSSYALFIIAERKYTKNSHNSSSPKRFDNVVVRSNFYKENFVMTGQPTAPTNINLLPHNASLEVLYDSPSNLSGVDPDKLRFHFYMNSDHAEFPYFSTTTTPSVLQESVTDVAGSSIATITKAFRTKAESNNRTNALDLLNDTEYKFSMNVVGTVGGNTLKTVNYNHTYSSGQVNGNLVHPVINLIANATVPVSSVTGLMSTSSSVFLSDSVPTVQNVLCLGKENALDITIDKDTSGQVNDLIIIIDEEDGLGSNSNLVPTFDTRVLRNVGSGTSSGPSSGTASMT